MNYTFGEPTSTKPDPLRDLTMACPRCGQVKHVHEHLVQTGFNGLSTTLASYTCLVCYEAQE